MSKPVVVLIGESAWADVVMERIAGVYRPVVYTSREGYVTRLADDNAALVLVDGDQDGWRFWVTTPKTSPATRRIPVILVSADAGTRDEALTAGADAAYTPSEIIEQLGAVLSEMARVVDTNAVEAMAAQCAEALPPEGREAIAKFNAGEFYKQHDLFEALWMQEPGPVRDLYRAILQVGIAYYQITRGNARGALKMLLRSVQWFALLPDACQGVDVAQLKADAARVRAELERLGEERIAEFDKALLKPVRMVGEDKG
jgi:predicted metal-dependent hydrolase